MSEKDICFVIMPYGDWFDHYYDQIYKIAISNAGLKPIRADELFTSSAVIDDIWELTKKAKIILADLTEKNPNVFYELGLAHALTKPALLITETMDDVPFDLRHLRVITFDKNNELWGQKLIDDITLGLKETLSAPDRAVLPTFLKKDNRKKTDKTIPKSDEIRELKYEMNYLRNTMAQILNTKIVPAKVKNVNPPPDTELINLIRSGIKKGVRDSRILVKLNSLHVPLAKAERLLSLVKEENNKG